jgi:hypothetical protein
MTELKRWLDDEDAPDHLRDLLGAGRRSLPLPGAVQARSARKVAALAALPVGFMALLTSSGTVLAAAAGMSLGVVASIGGPIVFGAEAPPETTAPAAAPSASPKERAAAQREAPAPPPATPKAPGPKASAGGARSVADSLGEETELLERSRQLIGSNPNGALALVEEHARRFPRGKLAIERQLIEVDAMQRSGRSAEARARILGLKRRLEGSIYEPRLKQLEARSGGAD